MKNVLIVGSGAREVAIARKVSDSKIENSLFCVSPDSNPQISSLCVDYFISPLDQVEKIVSYASLKRIDLVIVCLLYTSPSPRDGTSSRMPSSA